MKTSVFVGSLIEWINDEAPKKSVVERVLWIDPLNVDATLINIDRDLMPLWRKIEDIERALSDGTAIKRTVDPYAFLLNPNSKMLKHQAICDRAWEIIKDLVKLEPDIYLEKKEGSSFLR